MILKGNEFSLKIVCVYESIFSLCPLHIFFYLLKLGLKVPCNRDLLLCYKKFTSEKH